jgi:hypothetical protein
MAAGLLLASCSGGGAQPTPAEGVAPPAAATVIPTAWIDAATKAWPDSDGRKAGAMVVSAGAARQCVLGDEPVRALGTEFTWDSSGYGPLDPPPPALTAATPCGAGGRTRRTAPAPSRSAPQ